MLNVAVAVGDSAAIRLDQFLRFDNERAILRVCNRGKGTGILQLRTIAELNNEFHRTIWLASGSLTLIRFLDSLELPRSFSDSFWTEGDYRELVCSHHEEIAAAFGAGDSTAVRHLMERHMLASADMIASAAHADHESARAPICC